MDGEDDSSEVNHDKAPFRFNEVVEIYPLDFETEPGVVDLVGKRGAITGMAFNADSSWSFSVVIQSGENWYFDEAELSRTGILLNPTTLYGESDKADYVRIRVDPLTGEGACVAENPDLLLRGPTPLKINLDETNLDELKATP